MITTLLLAGALQAATPGAMPATDTPRCSATVKDECMEGGGMGGHHHMMHHKMHKKMMHKKMMHKKMMKKM